MPGAFESFTGENGLKEKVFQLQRKSLRKILTTGDLFAVGYGDVGSSIYYALGATALYALGATPIALLIAGAVFFCTALTYSEMATTFPEPGGSATFTRYAFNDLVSFIAGWGLLLDYIVTIAISSFAIFPYLGHVLKAFNLPYSPDPWLHCWVTTGIILSLLILNIVGVKEVSRLNVVLMVLTLVSQLFIVIFAGFLLLNLPFVISQMKIGVLNVTWSPSWGEFAKGCAMAMVAYTGIEAVAQLAAETKKPGIMIPRAVKATVGVLVFLYLGISLVGLSVVSPEELGTTYIDDPVAGIVSRMPIGGKILAPWFGLVAAVILLIASNAGLMGCSRLMFSMGEYYQVPRFFYKIHSRFKTPYAALAVFSILACLVVLASRGQMLFLADLYNFGAQIAFFSAHIALLVLRWKKPDLKRPFRAYFNIPFGKGRSLPLTAIIGALATAVVWLIVVVTKPQGRYLGLAWVAVGVAMYLIYRKKRNISPTAQTEIEVVKIPQYRPVHFKHILVTVRALGSTDAFQMACQLAVAHKAKLTAIYVLEVPLALPMHTLLKKREGLAEAALKRADAVAREFNLSVESELIRARSVEKALLDLIQSDHHDLLIVDGGASQFQRLFKYSPARVLFFNG
jgi:APA family basic amino acid/polyamine antiporter